MVQRVCFFNNSSDLQASLRFENKSNVQLGPFGRLTIKDGDTVVHEANFNNKSPHDVILPDSARRWEIPLEKIDGFGYHTVSAIFTYGKKNQTIEITRSFWVVPMTVIVACIIGVILLIGLMIYLWVFVRGRRHHKGRRRRHRGAARRF